jgi:hypothetical protein
LREYFQRKIPNIFDSVSIILQVSDWVELPRKCELHWRVSLNQNQWSWLNRTRAIVTARVPVQGAVIQVTREVIQGVTQGVTVLDLGVEVSQIQGQREADHQGGGGDHLLVTIVV